MRRKNIPVVSYVLLGLNILGIIWEYMAGEASVTSRYAMYQGALEDGEYIRLLTSGFLHYGLYHLASNMFCLVLYGYTLERRIGPFRYAVIYLTALIASGLLINWTGGNGLHAGASGAIWGLMTATLVYNLRNRISPVYAIRGIAVNLIYSFSAGVSWQGHIGGGIGGLAAALALCEKESGADRTLYAESEGGRYVYGGSAEDGNTDAGYAYSGDIIDENGNLIRSGDPGRTRRPAVKAILVAAAALAVCAGVFLFTALSGGTVRTVKNAHPQAYPDTTYRQAFSDFFADPEWTDISTEDGKAVRFTGQCLVDNKPAEVAVYFRVDDSGETEVTRASIDGEDLGFMNMGVLMNAVFGPGT